MVAGDFFICAHYTKPAIHVKQIGGTVALDNGGGTRYSGLYWLNNLLRSFSQTLNLLPILFPRMNTKDAIRVVTEDLRGLKLEYLYLMWYLCTLITGCLKKRMPAELLDLQAILEVELAKRHREGVG